jgi:hypothetical protein
MIVIEPALLRGGGTRVFHSCFDIPVLSREADVRASGMRGSGIGLRRAIAALGSARPTSAPDHDAVTA